MLWVLGTDSNTTNSTYHAADVHMGVQILCAGGLGGSHLR
jgi:hypothetical protein